MEFVVPHTCMNEWKPNQQSWMSKPLQAVQINFVLQVMFIKFSITLCYAFALVLCCTSVGCFFSSSVNVFPYINQTHEIYENSIIRKQNTILRALSHSPHTTYLYAVFRWCLNGFSSFYSTIALWSIGFRPAYNRHVNMMDFCKMRFINASAMMLTCRVNIFVSLRNGWHFYWVLRIIGFSTPPLKCFFLIRNFSCAHGMQIMTWICVRVCCCAWFCVCLVKCMASWSKIYFCGNNVIFINENGWMATRDENKWCINMTMPHMIYKRSSADSNLICMCFTVLDVFILLCICS